MKKDKVFIIIVGLLNIIMMYFPWFGLQRGVQEINGTIVLYNPLTLLALISLCLGVIKNCNFLSISGSLSLIIIELFYFFTWHIETITGTFDLKFSLNATYPEFYISLILGILLLDLNIIQIKRS